MTLQQYITWFLLLFESFFSTLDKQKDSKDFKTCGQDLDKIFDIFHGRFTEIVSTLWEVRVPFLTSKLSCEGSGLFGKASILSGLHAFVRSTCMVVVAYRYVMATSTLELSRLLRLPRNHRLTPDNSRAAHVLLAIWINARERYVQRISLQDFGIVVERGRYPSLYSDVRADAELREGVYKAVIRDLRDERTTGDDLNDVIGHTLCICKPLDEPSLKPREESWRRKVFESMLAACRRLYCRQGDLGGLHDGIGLLTSYVLSYHLT